MKSPAGAKLTVEYNAEEIEAVDLCGFTLRKDLSEGRVPNSFVTVDKFVPGRIEFTAERPQDVGWYGVVNKIKFRSGIDGWTMIKMIGGV